MNEQSLHTDTANDWITGYLTNSLTPEETQSLQEWLNASEENRKYFSGMDTYKKVHISPFLKIAFYR